MQTVMPFRVRFADTDKMGVVYQSNYVTYMHEARDDFFEQVYRAADDIERQGVIFPTHALDVVFNESLQYGDDAIILTELESLTPIRMVFHHRLFLKDADTARDNPMTEAHIEVYAARSSDNKPANLKKSIPELYEILKSAAHEEGQ